MADGLRVWLPEFGEHFGTDSEGAPVLSTGDKINIQLDWEGNEGIIATMTPQEAERLAGNLTVLAYRARRQERENNKTMEDAE